LLPGNASAIGSVGSRVIGGENQIIDFGKHPFTAVTRKGHRAQDRVSGGETADDNGIRPLHMV